MLGYIQAIQSCVRDLRLASGSQIRLGNNRSIKVTDSICLAKIPTAPGIFR